jgi:hypothetical protein
VWLVRNSLSDTSVDHTQSEQDVHRSLVWFVAEFQPWFAVEPFEAVRLRIRQRRTDVAESVDQRVDVGDLSRRTCALRLGPRSRSPGLGLVDRVDELSS